MSGITDVANVVVSAQQQGVSPAGFGTPMLLSQSQTVGGPNCSPPSSVQAWTTRFRLYSSLTAVEADFDPTTPEYQAAANTFSQSPTVSQIVIGRAANVATQTWTAAVAQALASSTYILHATDATGAPDLASFSYSTPGAVPAWSNNGGAGTVYNRGDVVTHASKYYVYVTPGTGSTSTGPTATDGTPLSPTADGSAACFYAGAVGGSVASNDGIAYNLFLLAANLLGQPWLFTQAYLEGDACTNDSGKLYQCTVGGVSAGSGGPTGSGGSITDGGVTWAYVGPASDMPFPTPTIDGSTAGALTVLFTSPAGVWIALENDDPTLITVVQDHADPGVAADLTAIANACGSLWYGLVTLYNSTDYVTAAAGWIEANGPKLYTPAIADTTCATTTYDDASSDAGAVIRQNNYARTGAFFHPRAWEFPDAAEMARFFPISPGSDNWRLKTLIGVTTGWANGEEYTDTQRFNLQGSLTITGSGPSADVSFVQTRNMNFYYLLGGVSVIGGYGLTGAGEYIDVTRFIDWWVNNVETRLANLLIQSEKIAYTDAGIGLLAAQVFAANADGVTAGGINPGGPGIPAPSVTIPTAGSESAANRAARTVPNLNTSWTLAGAINKVQVNALVST